MRKLLPLIPLIISVVYAQDTNLTNALNDLFGTATSRDPLIEVTTPKPNGFGALEKCGEGRDAGVHSCVPYDQCDGLTHMIIQGGSKNGYGVINIRIDQDSPCVEYLDVCCNVPPVSREPTSKIPVQPTDNPPVTPTVTPVIPPVTPVNRPVTSVNPPVNPPVTPATPRPSSLFCGIRNPNGIDFKITGNNDNEAEYGEFPWMVAILKKNFIPTTDENLYLCGGSLIAPNVVLTAAHCIADLKVNDYKVRAGEWDTQTDKERLPYQERDVVQAIIHEDFTPMILYNNVALLILRSPFDQADNIGSICLPSQDEVITSKKCFVTGWGKDVFGKEGKYQVILKKIEVPMVEYKPCQRLLRRTRLGQAFQLHSSFICAGGEAGKDACVGDGGGPLVCPDPKNPSRYVQTGIVSWGIGCGEKDVPGVYANVVKFRTWIDNQLSRLNINSNSYNV